MVWVAITLATLAAGVAVGAVQESADDARLHYLRAAYHFQSGNPHQALSELRLAIEADPESARLRTAEAMMLLSLSRPEEAVAALELALELDPEDAEAHRLLGRVYMQRGGGDDDLRLAEESLRRAAELDPDDRASLFFLSLLYDRAGRLTEAIEVRRRLLTLDPSLLNVWLELSSNFRQLGDLEGESEALGRAADIDPDDVELQRRAGLAAERLGRLPQAFAFYDRARELLQRQIAARTDDIALRLQLADLCLRQTGQFDIAAQQFGRALELAEEAGAAAASLTTLAEAAIGRAAALYLMEDYEPAAELFERAEELVQARPDVFLRMLITAYSRSDRRARALEILDELESQYRPDSAPFSMFERLRARVLDSEGRYEEADRILEELISSDPGENENYIELCQLRLGREDYAGAAAALDASEAGAGGSDDVTFLRGVVQERGSDFAAARATFSSIIEGDPLNHLALNYLGYMLADRGVELETALGYIRRAIELQPYSGSYLDSLGWAHFKLGELEPAERYLTAAVRTQYMSAEVREHLGYLYLALERPAEALAEFRAAMANDLASVKSTAEVEEEIARLERLLGER